jgi:prepilin-type processing-associated H-X9-DG protein
MYCPANPEQNDDGLWNFNPPNFRVIGYAGTVPGTAALINSNLNAMLNPPAGVAASQRVLLADATMSMIGQANEALRETYTYAGIPGGWSKPHRTSHLNGKLPAGGNLCMLDGHVEWRDFAVMHVRTAAGNSPTFWW